MRTAKVFKSGNSQAVRIPAEFQFDTDEVEIFRRDDELVLRKKPNRWSKPSICWLRCQQISWQSANEFRRVAGLKVENWVVK